MGELSNAIEKTYTDCNHNFLLLATQSLKDRCPERRLAFASLAWAKEAMNFKKFLPF